MRTIGVATVGRSDYGLYRPILQRVQEDPTLRLQMYVGGMHLSPEFGMTVSEIERDGFPIAERVEMLLSSDSPQGIAKAIGLGTIGFAQAFARSRPDILLVLGDRFDMFTAALAALPLNIPLAHIHGGEATEGLIDEAVRHSITKFSHLHFVSTEPYRERVIQLGEEPWRVVVSGAPGLDNLCEIPLLSEDELERTLNFPLLPPPLLVTVHPVTLESESVAVQVEQLMAALESADHPVVFTYPNADTYGRLIIQAIDKYVSTHDKARAFVNLGTQVYLSLMRHAAAMIGNSSSGIVEAASFLLPVVNIGNRQRGRVRGRNVIDVENISSEILHGIRCALDPDFRNGLIGMKNPYGDGRAAPKIVEILRTVRMDQNLLMKRFYDLSARD